MKRVYLEITNQCNLNCTFCTNEKGTNFLSLDEIKDYLGQIKPYCNYIYLHILGEPLLHPDFEEILSLLDKEEFQLQLVTNGTLLKNYPGLINHSCLRKLSISIHSINNVPIEDSYFETISQLIEHNNHKNMELRFYDRENLSLSLKDYLNSLESKYGFTVTSKANSYRLKENVYVYFNELFKWPSIKDPILSNNGKCLGGVDMIAINSNSYVTLCCLDPKAYNRLGNLKKNSLKEILESERYQNYLKAIKQNKITYELCSKCSYRLRFDNKLPKE